MSENKAYRCVNCGEPAGALYKTYGPTVIKLTKCKSCKAVVDKYIEYDPVIVMIDIVLMSKEAQRHVLYNTEFKSYWKLFIILMMLETYGLWRSDSLFNIVVNEMCGVQSNLTINTTHMSIPINISMPESWKSHCWAWIQKDRGDESDLFIWEKDFYILFLSTFSGFAVFIILVHSLMTVFRIFLKVNKVRAVLLVKGFSLAQASALLCVPSLVWGGAARALHYSLVLAYNCVMFASLLAVLYECPIIATTTVLVLSNCAKYVTSYHVTPYLREFIS